ncbi:hypothetical protein PGQ11_001821 [Apiospora arundinis]|uniref:Uncharacterized protein n=1 Tax=Apiospora arundinis TaxID=335852 RepID=A0ABR2JG84_9PEZI
MSSSYSNSSWEGLTLFTGETAGEMAQARINATENEIRRPGIKIPVMSEEVWQRRAAEAAKMRKAWYEKQAAESAKRTASDNEKVQPLMDRYLAEVNQQRQYQKQMPKKLLNYHEKPEGTNISSADWKNSYQDIGNFLAAALLAYHYQIECENGTVRGPPDVYKYRNHNLQLDVPWDAKLKTFYHHRGLSVKDDELKYFEGCVSKKVDFPIFLVAAVEDNLTRLSKNEDASLAAHKQLLAYILKDDLIREEITEVLLVSMEK